MGYRWKSQRIEVLEMGKGLSKLIAGVLLVSIFVTGCQGDALSRQERAKSNKQYDDIDDSAEYKKDGALGISDFSRHVGIGQDIVGTKVYFKIASVENDDGVYFLHPENDNTIVFIDTDNTELHKGDIVCAEITNGWDTKGNNGYIWYFEYKTVGLETTVGGTTRGSIGCISL